MKYKIVESVEKKENINHPVDDAFTFSEELLNIKSEKINESAESGKSGRSREENEKIVWDLLETDRRPLEAFVDLDYYAAGADTCWEEAKKTLESCPDDVLDKVAERILEDNRGDKNYTLHEIFDGVCPSTYRDGFYIEDDNEETLEEDFEYSEYDKKLLVNRAKTLAKQISDLYNSNQVEAQGELPSESEIAKALLDSPKKIDMYANFLSKIKGTKKAESIVEKLVKELMSFKKKLSMIKKPQPATESMNEAVEELSDEEKKEILDSLDKMIEAGDTGCECYDEPTKKLVVAELKKRGLQCEPSENGDHIHIEWYKKDSKNESMNESTDNKGICGERVEFKSGDEMLDALKSGSDFYNINTGDYVFGYNDSGSIAVYNLDLDEALGLQNSPYRDCGAYWGGLLGVGGYIYDDVSYESRNEYAPTNKDFCDDNYASDGWIELDYSCGEIDESLNEGRSCYAMSQDQMSDWNDICKAFAKKVGAKLVFVNDTSCGLEFPDGSMKHIYIDEMVDYLSGMNESCGGKKKSKKKNLKESVEDEKVIWKSNAQYEYWSNRATKAEIIDYLEMNDYFGDVYGLLDENEVESAFDECYEEMLEQGLEADDFDTEEKADALVEYGMRKWEDLIDIEKGRDLILDDDYIAGGECDLEDLQNMFDEEYGEFTDYSKYDTIYVVGDYQRWDGGHRVSAVFENGLADAVERVCYPGYDNIATLYKDENGNLTFTESSHDAPMGGTSLNFYCLTDDDADFDSIDEAIESGVLIPVKVNW